MLVLFPQLESTKEIDPELQFLNHPILSLDYSAHRSLLHLRNLQAPAHHHCSARPSLPPEADQLGMGNHGWEKLCG
jgi:hypothetical protein